MQPAELRAFCQLDELTYLCVTSEGPEDKDSEGLTMNEFYDCLREVEGKLDGRKIQFAYNLDGGGSATLYFNGKVMNKLIGNTQRPCADFLYFTR